MLGQDFIGNKNIREGWLWEKAESKQDHKEIKLQYSRQMWRAYGTATTEKGTQNYCGGGGGEEEGRLASLEELVPPKEQWETICWKEMTLVLQEVSRYSFKFV